MYCRDCHQNFDKYEADRIANKVPYGLGDVVESYTSRCPHCKSENILDEDDMIPCEGCGEWHDPEDMFYIDATDEWYCSDCYSEMFDIPDNI